MKKYNLLWTLMVLPAFITGCSDDLDTAASSTPAVAGDEIVFGAEASYESGNTESRTSYGDKYTDDDSKSGYQIINWEEGDMVRIDCAAAAQATSADYTVSDIIEGSTSGDKESTGYTLTKVGDGLQWGTGEHTFYAVYPSPAYFGENRESTQEQTTLSGSTVTGVIPVTQTPSEVKTNAEANGETYDYIFEPNMDYAYMAARAVYDAASEGGNGVTLHFKPLVTAIEVELNIGTINLNTGSAQQLTLNSVSLYDATGNQSMSGSFSADISGLNTDENTISGATITDMNESSTSNYYVTLNFNTAIGNNLVLGPEGKCLFTFFIHPSANFDDGNSDLKLLVNYTCDGTNTTKNYTIGKEIKAHKKYFFNNIILPNIDSETNVSSWFAKVQDDIYISQLSIPGAGNAASYNYSGTNSIWYKEQTMTLTEQWNAGVRCFELVSDYSGSASNSSLNNVNLVCNATSVGITFGTALDELTNLLTANPDECLIIICNYQPVSNSRNGQYYLNNLSNTFSGGRYNNVELVKLTATSTAGDIRGKMAIIGRITQEGEDSSTTLSYVPSWLTYIRGWGSLKDKWNRRYGDGYYPGYNLSNNMGSRSNMEDRLFTESSDESKSYPTAAADFLYETSDESDAWVQEWMRVVPEGGVTYNLGTYDERNSGGNNKPGQGGGNQSTTYTLYINWPESYTEKYNNITATFAAAKSEYDSGTGNTLFINSLCGYYVDSNFSTSCIPYISSGSVTYNGHSYSNDGFTGGGNGGNFEEYNEKINTDVYDYLLDAITNNTTGPLGIVMMDYVGSNDAGLALPGLIIQNNFDFPLRTK